MSSSTALTRRSVFDQAWPIMVGQASVPLVGIVDAMVIGRTGDATALAGVALGAMIISFIFWTFGFLRMGMTGLTAQAYGSGNEAEIRALLMRGLLAGGAIGLALFLLQYPLATLAFSLLAGGEQVSNQASEYVTARFLGAPAALSVFAINGWLLGLGRTRGALMLQIVMNIANALFDIGFVWGFDLGARGVGLGTAAAEWIAILLGVAICAKEMRANLFTLFRETGLAVPLKRTAMRKLFAVNRDLMFRTVALLGILIWFTNAGARQGAEALAANHVLMQFVNVAAFVLDAFAFTAESRVGNAIGAGSRVNFLRSIRLTGEFALASAVAIGLIFWIGGEGIINFITVDPQVRSKALTFLPYAAMIPLLGTSSWMLDGIFVGSTSGKALRNAAIIATLLYIALDLSLRPYGNHGVWIALCASYLLRAATLGYYFPALLRSIGEKPSYKRCR